MMLRDMRDGFRVLASRDFWRQFNDYWFGEGLSARMDDWVSRVRENTGQPPDEAVEARRVTRAAAPPPEVGPSEVGPSDG